MFGIRLYLNFAGNSIIIWKISNFWFAGKPILVLCHSSYIHVHILSTFAAIKIDYSHNTSLCVICLRAHYIIPCRDFQFVLRSQKTYWSSMALCTSQRTNTPQQIPHRVSDKPTLFLRNWKRVHASTTVDLRSVHIGHLRVIWLKYDYLGDSFLS